MDRWTSKRPTKPGFYWVRQQGLPDLQNSHKLVRLSPTLAKIVQVAKSYSNLVVWEFGSECETELEAYGDDTTRWKSVK